MTSPHSALRSAHRPLDAHFDALLRHVVGETGLHYYHDRPEDLAARLRTRMAESGCADAREYLQLVRGEGPASDRERARMVDAIAIGETFFFRFAEQFHALRDHVLPGLIRANAGEKRLRIWSAGCANGAEAYSVSILLKRSFSEALRDWDVTILATDLNERALERARAAVFTPWSLRALDGAARREYFEAQEDGSYRLRAAYREGVYLRPNNLLKDPPPEIGRPFDVIFCRNVLIYFAQDDAERALKALTGSLRTGGWLLLGHAEAALARSEPDETGARLQPVWFPGTFLHQKAARDASRRTVADALAPPGPPCDLPLAPVLPESHPEWPSPPPPVAPPVPTPPRVLPEAPEAPVLARAAPSATVEEPRTDTGVRAEVRALLDVSDADGALRRLARVLDDAVTPARHDPVLHYYHALALEHQEQLAAAEAALRRALYLDREFVLAHYHLALVAEARGNVAQARRSLDTVDALLTVGHRDGSDRAAFGRREELLREIGDVAAEEVREIARLRRDRLPPPEGGSRARRV